MTVTQVVSCYPMNCLLHCTNTLAFGKLLCYLMMPNCQNSALRSKGTQPSNNTLSNTSLGGEPMGCPWCFMVMKCQLLELAKSGPGHLCVFLIAPYLPMQWVVQWTTSSCIVGLSWRSLVCQVLHFFWVQWTLSSRSRSGPFRPCTWGFGQIQTGQGACITTALLKVGKLELLWLEVILVCCCN